MSTAVQKLEALGRGKAWFCWCCLALLSKEQLRAIGTVKGGGKRYLCDECAGQERSYARNPREECQECGLIRRQEGSTLCRGCQIERREEAGG